jgi:hypothetical protein
MKRFVQSSLVVFILYLSGTPTFAASILETTWLHLIRAGFDASCTVAKYKVGTIALGNNGFHSEQWFMHTCRGNYEYLVEYYPPSAFPGRASPYQVKRIDPERGVEPNNSSTR